MSKYPEYSNRRDCSHQNHVNRNVVSILSIFDQLRFVVLAYQSNMKILIRTLSPTFKPVPQF